MLEKTKERIALTIAILLVVLAILTAHTMDYNSRYGVRTNREYNPARTERAVALYRAAIERNEVSAH